LTIATDYHIEEAYSSFDRILLPKDEVNSILDFTENLLIRVCKKLEIDLDGIIKEGNGSGEV